jgi:uroporphyrin-III C-methyltransferase / precorrin-2 dehydrogenase / sirohydrochlorin ferrochelatase
MASMERNGAMPYPAFLDLAGRKVLVVGAGAVAARKLQTLSATGARIVVVAPEVCEPIAQMEREGAIVLERRAFTGADAAGCALVFAATGIAEVDWAVAEAARVAGAFVNVAGAPATGDFHVPASGSRGVIQVAVGTTGTSPGLAGRLRDRFLGALGPEWERFAELLGAMRSVGREVLPDAGMRQRALARAANDDSLLAAVARGETVSPSGALLRAAEGSWSARDALVPEGAFVSLVGSGPGSPGLLTRLGYERISSADVIVYDDLVDRRVLSDARADAELVYAGKRGWCEGPPRPVTGDLLVSKALEGSGRRVVRLKGGDPLVFGRAGEEIATLEEAGVPYEIVPGVTAALAAAAGVRIPLTLRGISDSLTLATGNSATDPPAPATGLPGPGEASGPPIASLASAALSGGTLCIYMGLKGLADICAALVDRGVSEGLPVAVVEGAYSESQKSVHGTLASIAGIVEAAEIDSPAMVIVGAVVGHSPDVRAEKDAS